MILHKTESFVEYSLKEGVSVFLSVNIIVVENKELRKANAIVCSEVGDAQ